MSWSVEELQGQPFHTVEGLVLLSCSPHLDIRPAALCTQYLLSVCWQMPTIYFQTVPRFVFSPKVASSLASTW